MGVGGNFWELLKPFVRREGPDRFRGRRIAVDLPFWVVQSAAGLGGRIRYPHIRNAFFRTVALFAKMGVFPVFVIDGEPSPLKTKARMERFYRGSGINPETLLDTETETHDQGSAATPAKGRNHVFTKCIEECVELLNLLGMPVLCSNSEAEALCAQLNNQGLVDACITADSDAFLYGARCVIKVFRPNCKEPFECYYASDIETGLGLRRKQMLAIALLVGTDLDLHGIAGFGIETALRFVQMFTEDEVLNRLREFGKGTVARIDEQKERDGNEIASSSSDNSPSLRQPHCSTCGHPGTKKVHVNTPCEYCVLNGSEDCIEKPSGFKCMCAPCKKTREDKECKRLENWHMKICSRIASQKNFPNEQIIGLYLNDDHGGDVGKSGQSFGWAEPDVEAVIDFLVYKQHWEPSYVRQRILPILTTIYLRKMAEDPSHCPLLYEQYEFHSIHRIKVRFGCPCYVLKWKRVGYGGTLSATVEEPESGNESNEDDDDNVLAMGPSQSTEYADEPDAPQSFSDAQGSYLLTDENMELVSAAFPQEVERFQLEKNQKKSKSKSKSAAAKGMSESSSSSGVQLSIKEFYRATKVKCNEEKKMARAVEEGQSQPGKDARRRRSPDLDKSIPKPVRRRLLFD